MGIEAPEGRYKYRHRNFLDFNFPYLYQPSPFLSNNGFPALFHAEEDSNYWQTIPYGWGEDHRFWGMPFGAPETRSYPIPLNNISITSGTATVRVRLKGRTNDGQRSPDHHTRIYLNDVTIDDQLWEGQTVYDHIASIPQTLLQEGTNTVQVASVGDTGAVVDQILVNWIEIGYLDTYVAEDNTLLFNAPTPGAFQFEIKNFASNNAVAFDITDAENVIRIKNAATYKEKGRLHACL